MRRLKGLTVIVIALLALLLAACGGGGAPSNGETDNDNGATDPSGEQLTIGYVTWAEDIAVTYLWKALLEEQGYEVEAMEMGAGPLFGGLAQGSIDLFLDAWLPNTHSEYMERYGDQLESLGIWYDTADLGLAVPDYVEIESLSELAAAGDVFGRQIVGIDAGAGLMRITQEEAMPGYGLDDWQLIEGSETTMLAALDKAVENEEPVVVTLWRPHWAFAQYPIRYLDDPENLMNPSGQEELHILATAGFSERHPDVARWLGNFSLDDDTLGSLEVAVLEADDYEEAAREWLEDHRHLVEPWFAE
ncbi:MAG TPA: glycine betaine ABC transporter substrate-binding protein [Sphingobacteriaceae bacterium]|nr:glycine betaine ABC transporter substrate-binding protein [Sphingobacteriaceae bacterium]